eukprot:4702179-Pyramimonas_sp.AAC.2
MPSSPGQAAGIKEHCNASQNPKSSPLSIVWDWRLSLTQLKVPQRSMPDIVRHATRQLGMIGLLRAQAKHDRRRALPQRRTLDCAMHLPAPIAGSTSQCAKSKSNITFNSPD